MNRNIAIFCTLAVALAGCFSPDPKSISSDSAPSAIPAIKDAAQTKDKKAVPKLVADLDDADPAIRFAAITALSRIVGQTYDYRYYDDATQRRPAVLRWQQWLREHPEK